MERTASAMPPHAASIQRRRSDARVPGRSASRKAQSVTVNVAFAPDALALTIVDDGAGFDPAKTPKNHYGLINMKERARKANGEVVIDSAPGKGTRVELRVKPVKATSTR